MAIYGSESAHTRCGAEVNAPMLARLKLTLPPNFFTVVIQQPGNSYTSSWSWLSLMLVGFFWMCKGAYPIENFTRRKFSLIHDMVATAKKI